MATTPEPEPLPRAPKDIAPSGRAPPTTRDKAYDSKAVRGELRRRCVQALISRKGSPNIKGWASSASRQWVARAGYAGVAGFCVAAAGMPAEGAPG